MHAMNVLKIPRISRDTASYIIVLDKIITIIILSYHVEYCTVVFFTFYSLVVVNLQVYYCVTLIHDA